MNSEFDEIFQRLYGFKPTKQGASYELLVAAVLKIIRGDLTIKANQFVEGVYSEEKYQIDALLDGIKTAVEAKDYSIQDKKVGRPDVTKLAGALQDLPCETGIVVSATEFSRQAKKFAEATKNSPSGKPIDLYHVRQSVEADEEGRIKTIIVDLHISVLDQDNVRFHPVFSPEGMRFLKERYKEGEQVQAFVYEFYRADGSMLITLADLSINLQQDRKAPYGSWIPSEPAYLRIGDTLAEISELQYHLPRRIMTYQIKIEAEGKAELLMKTEDGKINKLIRDVDLKRITFSQDDNTVT
jgi:Restriction endonuclease